MFVASPEDLSHGKCRSVRGELIMMVTWYLAASLDGGGEGGERGIASAISSNSVKPI